jgi:glycosyltransferase involved in cell wall biosynthesis
MPSACIRVVNIVTSSLTVRFLAGQPEYFEKKGFEVVVVSSPGEELEAAQRKGIRTVAIPMAREISPWNDLLSLWRLWRLLSRLRPTITNVATPKAGLLGGIAGWMCGIPCRYYSLIGLRCETTTGLKRRLLVLAERIACLCAHEVICSSESLRQKAIDLGVVDADRAVVLASGAYAGIDVAKFAGTADSLRPTSQIRCELGIPPKALVVGFVGRLTKDKGLTELVQAYLRLRPRFPQLRLLLVGDFEEADPLPAEIRRLIKSDSDIVRTGFVQNPTPFYSLMDVFAFPSHREGFGIAILEAHATGKPVVASRATGVVDAVIDGVTGFLVPVGDIGGLARALQSVLKDKALAQGLGAAGRERVIREFSQERVWDALIEDYSQLLRTKGLTVSRPVGLKSAEDASQGLLAS